VEGIKLEARNLLPAAGGIDREPPVETKLLAPFKFRTDLERAITAEDYATLAERSAGVQQASGELRWTGSWYEARVGIDALGHEEPDITLLKAVDRGLYRYRRVGHDLAIRAAKLVPLEIALRVCVLPGYLRGHVKAALMDTFSNRILPDRTRGFFHPDNITFGDGITLSALVAAAQSVTGVESVTVTKLERLGKGPNHEIEDGILPLGALEIARLDNDPNFPENGFVTFEIRGGR
jgi:predicted phage baseplate assembly protein